ncbi:MAG TPA: HEAT repeat domain-containing protein [Nitrospirales bacterium]|nr:HEAT repeat domain-containing protein [Nitrospirales bacterium]
MLPGLRPVVLTICVLIAVPAAWPGPFTAEQRQLLLASRSVYVAVEATTWMPKGRTLADVAPIIRRRLEAHNFTIVRSPEEPHDLTLSVRYAEIRGKAYRIDDYATMIRCDLRLEHRSLGELWARTVEANSGDLQSGTPPYLEALEEFQTNPYYFFLGEFVRAATEGPIDTVEVLSAALRRLTVAEAIAAEQPERPVDPGHGMLFTESVYTDLVVDKTIEELARVHDPRIIDLLSDLLRHPDGRIRLASVRALAVAHDPGARVALERVAERDPTERVRRAAAAALAAP